MEWKALATVAAQGAVRPSALVGIECEWCAYCLDDALVFRDWAETHRQVTEAQREQEMQAHIANARRMSQGMKHG